MPGLGAYPETVLVAEKGRTWVLVKPGSKDDPFALNGIPLGQAKGWFPDRRYTDNDLV